MARTKLVTVRLSFTLEVEVPQDTNEYGCAQFVAGFMGAELEEAVDNGCSNLPGLSPVPGWLANSCPNEDGHLLEGVPVASLPLEAGNTGIDTDESYD